MKKLLIIAVAAFLVTGIAFAQDTNKDKKECNKECCKKGKEKCTMDSKDKDAKCCDKKDTKKKD